MQLLPVPDDRIGVGADAVGDRLDKCQRNGGGEDGIHRAAALGEHLQAGLGGEGLRRRHRVAREQRLPRPGVGIVPAEAHTARTCCISVWPLMTLSMPSCLSVRMPLASAALMMSATGERVWIRRFTAASAIISS